MDPRRSRFLLVTLVLVHLVAISQQVDAGGGVSVLEKALLAMFSPFQKAIAYGVDGVQSAWFGYVDLRRVRNENARLEERLRYVERYLQEKQHLAQEAGRLRELLALKEVLPLGTTVAPVIARDGTPWFRTITVGKGSRAGIRLNAPVVSPTGVVGRVIGLGPDAAKVQLLLDRDSGVGVLIEPSRVTGVVGGQVGLGDTGTFELLVRYIPTTATVGVGDAVVTSGLDQIFPKGLMVGRVSGVGEQESGLFKEISVTPSAHFDRLEEVLVALQPAAPPEIVESVR